MSSSTLSYRPSTSGGGKAANGVKRQTSLSSFPPASKHPTSPPQRNGRITAQGMRGGRRMSSASAMSNSSALSMRRSSSQASSRLRTRRLRSQYPADSDDRHVEYILVASFDIDKGSIMEHQYPEAISGDEGMLAELMLPDQAHARTEDWTIFFLHKDIDQGEDNGSGEEGEDGEKMNRPAVNGDGDDAGGQSQEAEDDSSDDDEGPPLIYVLNLVNTKHDATAKRGAVVKAMAICTRHPFLHIYKPLLLLALEDYYKSPVPETLESLYNAVNAMDLSLMPRFSMLERQLLLSNDTKDLFIEKFEQMIQQRMASESNPGLVDGQAKSPGDMVGQRPRYALPRDTHEFESKVMYNTIPVPIKIPSAVSPETVGDFSMIKLIQTFHGPQASSPQPFALHSHLTTSGAFTHPIIVLINAVLTEKRVIFLGHNRPSGEVAEAVLATCALASGGILKGFTRHAFPYTDLTKIDDLLNVPGFIAGVTNPTFANHPEWWDLLCDIPTGRMKISSKIEAAPMTDGVVYYQQQNPGAILSPAASKDSSHGDATRDNAFMESVMNGIASRHGEYAIRSRFREYITKFTRIAATFEETVYGASALYIGASEADAGAHGVTGHGYVWPDDATKLRELGANVWRIEGWRNTRSYYALIQDLAAAWERKPIRAIDLAYQHDRLRTQKLSREDSAALYLALIDCVRSYDEICQLLTVTPQANAGLFFIGLGLFHPDLAVREGVVDLLELLLIHVAGRHFWAQMSRFQKQGFTRTKRNREDRLTALEAEESPTHPAGGDEGMGLGLGLGVQDAPGGVDLRAQRTAGVGRT